MKPAKDQITGIRLYHKCGYALWSMSGTGDRYYWCDKCQKEIPYQNAFMGKPDKKYRED